MGNTLLKTDSNNYLLVNCQAGCGGGGSTPGSPLTSVQFNSASAFAGSANLTWVSPALSIGAASSATGQLKMVGTTSGVVTVQSQAAAGTYNFNLPTSAGSSGQPLLSGGGGATAMSFGTLSGNTTTFVTASGALTSGKCLQADASGNIATTGSACGSGGGSTSFYQTLASQTNVAADSPVTVGSAVGIYYCNATAGAITYNLPAVASSTNFIFTMVKTDSSTNNCTLDGNASETINGALTYVVNAQYSGVSIHTTGSTGWTSIMTSGVPLADPGADKILYFQESSHSVQPVTLSGAFSFSAGSLNLASNGVALSNLATQSNNTILGNTSGSTAAPSELTAIPLPQPIIWLAGVNQAGTATVSCNTPSSGAATAVAAATTVPPVGVASYSGSAQNDMHCEFITPGDWTSSSAMDITLYWRAASTTGSVVWQVSTLFVGDGTVLNTAYNSASTVTDAAKGTTLQVNTATITGVTSSGTTSIAANKLAFVDIGRNGGVGSDNMSGTAELIGFVITIRRTPTIGG
jgi:hypothetical protein